MAFFRRKRRKKAKEKMTGESPNASLAKVAPIIESRGIFEVIHQEVKIPQKAILYRPADKLVLILLMILWIRQWGIEAIAFMRNCDEWVEQIRQKWQSDFEVTESQFTKSTALLAERGIKRFTHQLFALAGTLTIKNGKLRRIVLKAGYPMIDRIVIALTALLAETEVEVALGKT